MNVACIKCNVVLTFFLFFNSLNIFAGSGNNSIGNYFVFSYFYGDERQNEGLHLAVSTDGLNWTPVKKDSTIFHPGFGERFRDPTLIYDVKNPKLIHMLWTTERKDGFGIASSYNLTDWFDVMEVVINQHVEGVINTWAPELIWDEDNRQWVVYWGSSIEGKFPETEKLSKNPKANNRMYYAVSKDLKTWSAPALLQDFGFPSNDCYIYKLPVNHLRGKYIQFVKQIEKPGSLAYIRMAYADSLLSKYKLADEYLTKKYKFSEGPCIFGAGDYFYMIVDLSQEHRMAMFRTKEVGVTEWEDVTDIANFPLKAKHGCVLRISKALYENLNNFHSISQ